MRLRERDAPPEATTVALMHTKQAQMRLRLFPGDPAVVLLLEIISIKQIIGLILTKSWAFNSRVVFQQ